MKSLLKFQHNKLCISAGFVEGGGGRRWRRRLAEAAPLFLEFSNKKQTTRKKKKNREVPLDFNSVPVAFVLIKL